ncbi:MAG: hypothetical protein ACFNKK_04605, partial [Peptidiphaga sp.]
MTGFASLFAVEARTMWRTWHRYALPVVLVFLAALSVALSRFAPELFKALAGEGFQIELPEPSPDQSYAQWAKNLTQVHNGILRHCATGGLRTEGDVVKP